MTSVHPSHGGSAENPDSMRSLPTAGQLGGKASDMEEGILTPVADQNQPRHPPPASAADLALVKRETQPKLHPRGPAPSHHAAPSGHQYVPQPRHPPLPSPVLVHPPHIRSPFHQQPTPPLTPLQMGQGGLVPPGPLPSPPALGPPMIGPPCGSPNLSHGGGWGYHQAPQHPPLPQHQQHPYRPPLHPTPPPVIPHQSTLGAPWVDPSPQMYPTVVQHNTQCVNGSGPSGSARSQAALAGGFSLTPQHMQEVHHTSPVHVPSNSAPLPSPPDRWVQAPSSTPPPPPPPTGAPPALDLERGMSSPWQGAPNDAGSAAPPGVGENETGAVNGTKANMIPVESAIAARQGLTGAEKDASGKKDLKLADVVSDVSPSQVTPVSVCCVVACRRA